MLGNLQQFEPPQHGTNTICELEGRIYSQPSTVADISSFSDTIRKHPRVHITRDLLHPNKQEEGRDLLLPSHPTFLKHIAQIYWEQGWREALLTASLQHQSVINKPAHMLLKLTDKINTFKLRYNPKSTSILIEEFSQSNNWQSSPIRAISWHSTETKIAVASSDDVVRIFASDTTLIPTLKCKQQKNITCIAWRPKSNSDLAVACEFGIIIWIIDPHSMVTRPSMNQATIITRYAHSPIASIAWNRQGDILASVAANDSKILLWHPENKLITCLKRPGTIGYCLLKWSLVVNKLFSASSLYVFRVWNDTNWCEDRWSVQNGRVQACCWSPDGNHLLFSTNEEPIIYLLSFQRPAIALNANGQGSNEAVPLFDVAKMELNGVAVGGRVRCLDWDPKGKHVAVLFRDSSIVAVFSVTNEPTLRLTPGFLISGNAQETPNVIMFQLNFAHGACLSIGWSSGRLQHFPIVYSDKLSDAGQRCLRDSFVMSPNCYYTP